VSHESSWVLRITNANGSARAVTRRPLRQKAHKTTAGRRPLGSSCPVSDAGSGEHRRREERCGIGVRPSVDRTHERGFCDVTESPTSDARAEFSPGSVTTQRTIQRAGGGRRAPPVGPGPPSGTRLGDRQSPDIAGRTHPGRRGGHRWTGSAPARTGRTAVDEARAPRSGARGG